MTSLQDKAAQLRRDHIVEAAIKVFAAKGYHRATIHDIAKAAGIADGTLYSSFKSKAALLMAVLDPLDEASAAPTALHGVTDLKAFLRIAITRRFASMTPEKLDVLRVVLSEALVNEELRVLYVERILKPALSIPLPQFGAADDQQALDPALVLRLVAGAVTGLVVLRLMGDTLTATHWETLGEALAHAVVNGLTLPNQELPNA